MPNTPEIPRKNPTEPPKEALSHLKTEVPLPVEAKMELSAITGVLADSRDQRSELLKQMKQTGNMTTEDLRKLEMTLAVA